MGVFLGAPRIPVSTHVDASLAQRRVVHMATSLLLDYPDAVSYTHLTLPTILLV